MKCESYKTLIHMHITLPENPAKTITHLVTHWQQSHHGREEREEGGEVEGRGSGGRGTLFWPGGWEERGRWRGEGVEGGIPLFWQGGRRAMNPWPDVTRSPKYERQRPYTKDLCPPKH